MKRKGLIIGIGAFVAIAIVLAVVLINVFGKTVVNLNDYLEIEYSGYDGVATAVYTIDTDEIIDDYGDEVGEKIVAAISGSFDKETELSNGDKVTFEWDCDEEALENIKGYKFKYRDESVKISDLKEGTVIDYFANMEVTFSGYEGYASVHVRDNFPDREEYKYVRLKCDNDKDIYNGDEIVVSLIYNSYSDYTDEELADFLYDEGKWVPKEFKKTVVVSGLDTYLTKIEDLPEADLNVINEYAKEKCIDTSFQYTLTGSSTTKAVDYVGAYIVKKPAVFGSGDDYITYFVYEVTVNNKYSDYDEDNKYYWCISLKNISTNEAGELIYDVSKASLVNDNIYINAGFTSSWGGSVSWCYKGYKSTEAIYKALVEPSNVTLVEDTVTK